MRGDRGYAGSLPCRGAIRASLKSSARVPMRDMQAELGLRKSSAREP